ncbi:hypothetical protein F4561_002707 [Lipingzhangella halophila]|uniref:FtsK domain-containing protein n=1 Tax=Lipingzhangella halophila TaxID=1783352 RepID=A0A7W7W2D7_9ACTN|nr:FtsK/SpoIIIE domain-containing protein [Lipingzhangella halophila]MBB4931887.1 hypothetical protein [Lipingzhangella halophila]
MAQPERHLHPVPDTEAGAAPLVPARQHIHTPAGRSWFAEQGQILGALLRSGVGRHAHLAGEWIADPAVETQARLGAESRRVRLQVRAESRITKARTDAQKADATNALARAQQVGVNELEISVRTAVTRACRALVCASVPVGVTAGPVYLTVTQGEWVTLLAWPGVAGYLLVQEWAAKKNGASAVRATEAPSSRGEVSGRPVAAGVSGSPVPAGVPGEDAPPTREIVGATPVENRILERLTEWDALARKRGLAGVRLGEVTLDESGICVVLDTHNTLTPAALTKKTDTVRAVLGVPTATRIEITHGDIGDQAMVRIRTREKELDTTWRPGCEGIGADSDTGEVVELPKGRKLIAGTSGSGKSVLLRVVMADALCADEPTTVVYIDGKGEESALWDGKARVAVEPEEILQVVRELVAESQERRDAMRAEKAATWAPTKERPRIVVVVDEGAEVIAVDHPDDLPILAGLRSLARTGRSRCIDLVWCTQKPTLGDGIDRQINGVMEIRAVLRTAGDTETRQVLGTRWPNHTWTGTGLCVVKGTGREEDQSPVRVWDLSDDAQVQSLPDRDPWHYRGPGSPAAGESALEVARRLCGAERGVHTAALEAELGTDTLGVHTAMAAFGIYPDKTSFWAEGTKARGYRREALLGDEQ